MISKSKQSRKRTKKAVAANKSLIGGSLKNIRRGFEDKGILAG